MTDFRIKNLARIMVEYSSKVKPKEHVAIYSQPVGIPLVRELYRATLNAGAYPYFQLGSLRSRVELEGLDYILFTEGSDDQIQHVNQFDRIIRSEFDVMLVVQSQTNTRGLSGVDPARQGMRTKAYTDLTRTYLQRSSDGDLRWTMTLFPTEAYAQDAEMSLTEFEEYVYSTTYADSDDPIAAWQKIHEEQQKPIDWLSGKKHVHVKGPHADFTLSIEGRKFINSDGSHNMPSGEIFTGPVEDSINGWVRYSYPAVYAGREVDGIELHFEQGKVIKATATKNQAFLEQMLDLDAGARYLGEFAIGTNKRINRFIKNILFDEKIGGTIHMAVGAGYPETGSVNQSAIHWDMICDMRDGGQIIVDDELFYESGEFTI
ncbi:MAG: aminopeptidase [Anaerolineales bacterium]|nr:aminopeptidase [Anaerolineales bacterium]